MPRKVTTVAPVGAAAADFADDQQDSDLPF
jgi:hypothetical protein